MKTPQSSERSTPTMRKSLKNKQTVIHEHFLQGKYWQGRIYTIVYTSLVLVVLKDVFCIALVYFYSFTRFNNNIICDVYFDL